MLVNGVKVKDDFYERGARYWYSIEPTIDGMLGGFASITDIDIRGSDRFLSDYMTPLQDDTNDMNFRCGLDCGSGIGRITKGLLLKYCHEVDLLEVNPSFLKEARNHIGPKVFDKRIRETYCSYLHKFKPKEGVKYDLIWCQWVTGHLTDGDFVSFLELCRRILKPNGLMVIKDNHTSSDEADDDTKDGSVTRPYWLLKKIFLDAGMYVLSERRQYRLPKGLYPVVMFALRPSTLL